MSEQSTLRIGDLVFFDDNPGVVASTPRWIVLDSGNIVMVIDVFWDIYPAQPPSQVWVSDLMTAEEYRVSLLSHLEEYEDYHYD